MAVLEFAENYEDLSTDQEFQFRFYCDRCGNGYTSSFKPKGIGGSFLRAAGGLMGGFLGDADDSAFEFQQEVDDAHDRALEEAIAEIKPLFAECKQCGTWVCQQECWNADKGLCKECAPC